MARVGLLKASVSIRIHGLLVEVVFDKLLWFATIEYPDFLIWAAKTICLSIRLYGLLAANVSIPGIGLLV